MNDSLVLGVGTFGTGIHKSRCKKYNAWIAMLNRCYSGEKESHIDITVCDDWLNYQVFGDWYEENYIEDYHIDKDYKIYGNKVYSPEACLFIPSDINNAFLQGSSRIDKRLPIGVRQLRSGNFETRVNGKSKTFLTIEECKKYYWDETFVRCKNLMQKYPEFSYIIFDYFVNYKNENYHGFKVEIDAYKMTTISDLFYVGMSRNINEPLFFDGGKQINLGAGTYKTVHNAESIDYPEYDFDNDKLPYKNDSIDVFHAYHLLEHLIDPKHLLKEVERCLVVGGYINIVVPYYSSSLQASCLDHVKSFNERTWKNFMQSYSYNNGSSKWKLSEHLNIIIGIEQNNICLMTQLIKTGDIS